jgi:HAD superfamily hydrolase (TIGR01662 family)
VSAFDSTRRRIEAVVFDFGETLIDETHEWSSRADRAGVPRLTFLAVLGALIRDGRPYQEVFDVLGVPSSEAARHVGHGPRPTGLRASDLYPDARPCLAELRRLGFRIGIAANQPDRAAEILSTVGVELDLIATSAARGVEKPSPEFFARIATELALPAKAIAYVGDRVDNDVTPAAAAGMTAVFLRRGPWAWIQCPVGTPAGASFVISDLTALPELLLA